MSESSDDKDDLTQLSTVELLERVREGSDEAKDVLYRRYLPRMRRWARGRVPRKAQRFVNTDDIVQEVMMKTLTRLDDFEPEHGGAFQGYVRQALRNRLTDELRSVSRRPSDDESAGRIPDVRPSPREEVLRREQMEHYERALDAMPVGDQVVIMARLEDGLSYQQIALELGKPSRDAARMAVSRAVARLAQHMTELDGGTA